MNSRQKKQFIKLAGVPILFHTLNVFDRCAFVSAISIALPPDEIPSFRKQLKRFPLKKKISIVEGGSTRQDSVYNALLQLPYSRKDIVVVHDAVRPFIQRTTIEACVTACSKTGAAIAAVPSKDTVRLSEDGNVFCRLLDRKQVWLIQTPQVFKTSILLEAYEKAFLESYYSTDDAALVERLGIQVAVVPGSYENIKITTPDDIRIANVILKNDLRYR